jgi:hypothetical protein
VTDRALRAATKGSWTSKLAHFAQGKTTEQALTAAAQNEAQRTEVKFYTGLARRIAQQADGNERLRSVLKSPILGLVEVELAREILAGPRTKRPVPKGTKLP